MIVTKSLAPDSVSKCTINTARLCTNTSTSPSRAGTIVMPRFVI